MNRDDIQELKETVESLGLDMKSGLDFDDVQRLAGTLLAECKVSLSMYVEKLQPGELEDLIVNTIYG